MSEFRGTALSRSSEMIEKLTEIKREFLEENAGVDETNLNCMVDELIKETTKVYTQGQWERKIKKVRLDEKSCRERHDEMVKEISSLKRKLLESQEKINQKK